MGPFAKRGAEQRDASTSAASRMLSIWCDGNGAVGRDLGGTGRSAIFVVVILVVQYPQSLEELGLRVLFGPTGRTCHLEGILTTETGNGSVTRSGERVGRLVFPTCNEASGGRTCTDLILFRLQVLPAARVTGGGVSGSEEMEPCALLWGVAAMIRAGRAARLGRIEEKGTSSG